ncbi:GspH/FimT family pseudopilin [Thioalkalivibrio sp. ALE23]|uniref:GspH/FimT family pseudopilin n=1 Tax=Thioalkalivibrio sp. ALE23 TaxID=1265495 RepID=UPI000369A5FB|nr:GspH/FimT family pseudopilin [Thioalkalivibrio sp. ALE23]
MRRAHFSSSKPRHTRGFTLIELMVTLAVFVIIVTIGIPGFQNLVAQNRATTTANELNVAMHAARSAAVTHPRDTVSVCAADVEEGANDPDALSCGEEEDWELGWIVYRDADDGNDELIRVRQPLRSSITIEDSGIESDGTLEFTNTGTLNPDTVDFSGDGNVTFEIDVTTGRGAERCVRVGVSGRARVDQEACD